MNKRISPTLAICAIGAVAVGVGLFLPARQTSTAAPVPAEAAEPNSVAPASPALTPSVVSIENFSFGGVTTVGPGEEITVSNLDAAPHTMTANDGSFDTATISSGSAATLTMPDSPGTYQYFCSIHPSMVSTITVQS